ncbi:MAG: lysophospholipid acyltransferase family protein [Chloroflexi bacterium]|nr:lysophospholipid acyltransferase family protein [Chloroflexota bacterium]MBU1749124.1 lysophospholipid acyltransferase family protein [Chloroflexota bacterium]MBU1880203.1 lysophospholipid acyltransferase family protein [Chloroflexota bacterium]
MLVWVIRGLSWLAGRLPRRLDYAVAIPVLLTFYAGWPRWRAAIQENLGHVLGPTAPRSQVRRTARQVMRNYAKVLVEFLRLPHLKEDEITRAVANVPGEEHLIAVRDAKQGVIVATLHLGNWDIAALGMVYRGLPVHVFTDSFGSPQFDALIHSYRTRQGIQLIPANGMAVRRAYRILKQGGAVAIAFDVPVPLEEGGIPVRFFDGTIMAPAGPARLALRTGAVVLPGISVRQPDDSFRGWIKPPVTIEPTGDEEQDARLLTQAIAHECEDFVRHHPEQWYMFRPLWTDHS